MPIEFACESCTKLLRVPDGTEGSACQCPACGTLLEIPNPKSIQTVEVVDESSASDQLEIACPKCSHKLKCDPSLVGTKGQCRSCQYIFVISTDPPSSAGDAETQPSGWIFTCPKCDQLFEGSEEMRGRKGKCHECGEVFEIELRPADPPQPVEQEEELGFAETDDAKAAAPAAVETPVTAPLDTPAPQTPQAAPTAQPVGNIQIACSSCEGVMEVPASAAGQTTACPYCKQLLSIPDVPAQAATAPANITSTPQTSPTPSSFDSPGFEVADNSPPDPFADLGDLSGSLPDPLMAAGGGQSVGSSPLADSTWQQTPQKRRRGLTFSNAFSLLMETAFPACLTAALIYFMMGIANAVITYGGGYLVRFFIVQSQISRDTAVYVAGGFLLFAALCGIALGTAGLCMVCNGALSAVRKKRNSDDLFSTGGTFLPMLVYVFCFTVVLVLLALIPQGLGYVAGPNPIIILLATLLVFVLSGLCAFTCCLAPIAIADGDGPFDAVASSAQIVWRNFPAMAGVFLCILFVFPVIVLATCGIGGIILAGLPIYFLAAAYHLGDRYQ